MLSNKAVERWLIENCTINDGIGDGVIHLSRLDLRGWDIVIDNLKCDNLFIDNGDIEDELSLSSVICNEFRAFNCEGVTKYK